MITTEPEFRLHVPLETLRDSALGLPPDGRLIVLGKSATLHNRQVYLGDNPTQIAHWLLFDPLPKSEAERLLANLRARLPVLSFRYNSFFTVPGSSLTTGGMIFNGPFATIIPAEIVGEPAWVDASVSSAIDGAKLLSQLDACPILGDPRVIAAIQLSITSRFDTLPRSIFLSQLTIIDSLAERTKRSSHIQFWLDEKVEEARAFGDQGLLSALVNLKEDSHGSAVRKLVERASQEMGEESSQTKTRRRRVGELYRIRSELSHANSNDLLKGNDVSDAREIVDIVINAAINDSSILEVC